MYLKVVVENMSSYSLIPKCRCSCQVSPVLTHFHWFHCCCQLRLLSRVCVCLYAQNSTPLSTCVFNQHVYMCTNIDLYRFSFSATKQINEWYNDNELSPSTAIFSAFPGKRTNTHKIVVCVTRRNHMNRDESSPFDNYISSATIKC